MTMDRKTVFIADDNPQNLKVLSDILEAENYKTRASLSGTEMLESIKIQKPDLIILDIHMPKMDGYEICEQLKKNLELKDIPVIFCSALGETYNIVKAFEAGGVDYITKPFHAPEVLARIKTHIELREKQTDLEEALSYLKSAQNHLIQAEKMTSMGILVAGIAHEINNPINYIINSLKGFQTDFIDLRKLLTCYEEKENLPDCPFTEEINRLKQNLDYPVLMKEMQDLLDGIYTGTMKVHEIVKSLRILSTVEDEPKEEISVKKEIDRAILMIEYKLDENIRLRKDIQKVPDIIQQPGRLTQAILQLLKNSLDAIQRKKAIGSSETITIETYPETVENRPVIVIKISDTGDGMTEETLHHVFDPFFTTKEIGTGTGLGLTICYEITKDFNGNLEIRSQKDEGTTATITLPV